MADETTETLTDTTTDKAGDGDTVLTEDEETASEDQEAVETEDKTEGDDEEKPEVPEKYDLKLPEGSTLDPSVLETTAALSKKLGLSNEQAQELVDHDSQLVQSHTETLLAQHQQQVQQWAKDSQADKEFGGEKFKASVQDAQRVLDKYGSDALRKELDSSGFGNHPEVIRFLSKIGATMREDTLETGNHGDTPPKSIGDRLYGNKHE